MTKVRSLWILFILFFFPFYRCFSQSIPAGFPVFEELARRGQLIDSVADYNSSFLLRPIYDDPYFGSFCKTTGSQKVSVKFTPGILVSRLSSERPYGWSDYGMIPNPGFQTYLSGGINLKYKFIKLSIRPEFTLAQNLGFQTGLEKMTDIQIQRKYFYWNAGDFPEKFGDGWHFKPWWGQSKLSFQYGAFEIGAATENIWWGPGQFNSLTFSNNAQGFPHLTFNTTKPARTFLGHFEGQLIMGGLENSGFAPAQDDQLNQLYFKPFSGDWRYLNAITISWNPKWIKGFFFGFSRTFQQYNASRGNTFLDWFPIFEGFQKEKLFEDGHTVAYDANGRDQTISLFGRFVIPRSKSELYFEFGKRDHAYNWREYILNPEHARAFILGFNQMFEVPDLGKSIQVRSEITHQQESVNRYIRYRGVGGGLTWHIHSTARGFTNYGQPLGVGVGVGSNVQTMEISLVEGLDKVGLLFERLANNQDFYYKALLQNTERKPWIDLSVGFLYDKKIDNLLLSSKLQLIHARNYQWQINPASTPEFPQGKNLTSVMAQASLIYFWNKEEK